MKRLRRLRANKTLRNLVRETRVDKKELIYPIFVIESFSILLTDLLNYLKKFIIAVFRDCLFSESRNIRMNLQLPPMTITELHRGQ